MVVIKLKFVAFGALRSVTQEDMVVWVGTEKNTEVSEEHVAYIIRVKSKARKNPRTRNRGTYSTVNKLVQLPSASRILRSWV
jgi:hypothetical protein